MSRGTRRRARALLAAVLYYTGLLRLAQRIMLRRRAVVLMYHRVLTKAEHAQTASHPGIVVTRETFARHMAELQRSFKVLTVEEFADRLASKTPFDDASCLITFDDGWVDNFVNAFPVLRERRLPAVIFLPVNFVGSDRTFWRETLTGLLVTALTDAHACEDRRRMLAELLRPAGLAPLLDMDLPDVRRVVSEAIGALKAEPGRADELARQIAALFGSVPPRATPPDTMMDWAAVEAMSKDGVAFGGHGAEHRLLTRVSDDEAEHEIATSWRVLRERLGRFAPAFAYPNGSWSPAIAERVRRCGYQLGFTTEPGTVDARDNPMMLKRVNIHEDGTETTPLFLARLVGIL